jgi:hypothetical protein
VRQAVVADGDRVGTLTERVYSAGVAGLLMEAREDLARQERVAGIVLATEPDMHAAHRLYERRGYTRQAQRDRRIRRFYLLPTAYRSEAPSTARTRRPMNRRGRRSATSHATGLPALDAAGDCRRARRAARLARAARTLPRHRRKRPSCGRCPRQPARGPEQAISR